LPLYSKDFDKCSEPGFGNRKPNSSSCASHWIVHPIIQSGKFFSRSSFYPLLAVIGGNHLTAEKVCAN